MSQPTISTAEKAAITATRQRLIDEVFKPRCLPTVRLTKLNYAVDILGKWNGARYRFLQRHRSRFPENAGEELDAPFARIDRLSRDRFDLQWHRHTGEWLCLHRGPSLAQATKAISKDELLHPH